MNPRVRRRLHQLVLIVYAFSVLGSFGMVIGPWLNDRAIEANPGRALATVTDVSMVRTTVDFIDEEGILHSPPTGLLYPTGLGAGQSVWVNYDTTNPDLVKVEGREWTLAIIPALSVLVVATLIAAGLWWGVSRAGRRGGEEGGVGGGGEVHEPLAQTQPSSDPEARA